MLENVATKEVDGAAAIVGKESRCMLGYLGLNKEIKTASPMSCWNALVRSWMYGIRVQGRINMPREDLYPLGASQDWTDMHDTGGRISTY